MNAVADKFEQFEWLTHGISAKTANYEPSVRGTGEKPLNYEDRLGAIASMGTQLEKSVTSLIIYGESAKSDYEFIRNHLARIMMNSAYEDKRREPSGIAIYHLSWLVAGMVMAFALDVDLESNFTAKGRLHLAAGVKTTEMTLKAYDATWKQYENLMVIALEMAIKDASDAIETYKKNTYREVKN